MCRYIFFVFSKIIDLAHVICASEEERNRNRKIQFTVQKKWFVFQTLIQPILFLGRWSKFHFYSRRQHYFSSWPRLRSMPLHFARLRPQAIGKFLPSREDVEVRCWTRRSDSRSWGWHSAGKNLRICTIYKSFLDDNRREDRIHRWKWPRFWTWRIYRVSFKPISNLNFSLIPPDTDLIFQVHLTKIETPKDEDANNEEDPDADL